MLTEESYLNAWLLYGAATLVALVLLARLLRRTGPTLRHTLLLMFAGLVLAPAHPDDTVTTWAPAFVVAAFNLLTEGVEAAAGGGQSLLAGQALALAAALLLAVGRYLFKNATRGGKSAH